LYIKACVQICFYHHGQEPIHAVDGLAPYIVKYKNYYILLAPRSY